ncbi:MAG: hypothetical protein ACJAT4_000950 [Granulosicoccus sp.]|jgi:hypothetical protein
MWIFLKFISKFLHDVGQPQGIAPTELVEIRENTVMKEK